MIRRVCHPAPRCGCRGCGRAGRRGGRRRTRSRAGRRGRRGRTATRGGGRRTAGTGPGGRGARRARATAVAGSRAGTPRAGRRARRPCPAGPSPARAGGATADQQVGGVEAGARRRHPGQRPLLGAGVPAPHRDEHRPVPSPGGERVEGPGVDRCGPGPEQRRHGDHGGDVHVGEQAHEPWPAQPPRRDGPTRDGLRPPERLLHPRTLHPGPRPAGRNRCARSRSHTPSPGAGFRDPVDQCTSAAARGRTALGY